VKNNQLILTEKSKEELIDEILKLREENEKLKKSLEEKGMLEARKKLLKIQRAAQRKKRPKHPGQKLGHAGLTRLKPNHIDRVVEQTLDECPDCHHSLSACQEVTTHTQEDVMPAQAQVTLFKRYRYYCKTCQKTLTAPYAGEEIPRGYLGPNILIQTLILKYHHGLPFNKIRELFESLSSFHVSEGALSSALYRMSEWLSVETNQILEAIQRSPEIHMDETGWKVSGVNHWLWAAVNQRLAYYKIDKSRGSKVPKKILPKDYGGVLITDFYAAYNKLPGKKQKCLVHLMREMKSCFQKDQSVSYLKYHKQLKRIIRDALRLKERKDLLKVSVFRKRYKRLKERLFVWSCRDYRNQNLKRLAKRFLKHWLHLLTFLEHPKVDSNNNLAERMIRSHVILRNRSFQNRSQKGVRAHERLMSLLHTLKLQNQDPIQLIQKAYLKHRQGNSAPILSF